jgi:hypothetical protein
MRLALLANWTFVLAALTGLAAVTQSPVWSIYVLLIAAHVCFYGAVGEHASRIMRRWRLPFALLLSCGLAFGQVQIHYSRQSDVVTKALVGTIPQGVALYRAEVINVGTSEARVFPARVGFEAAAVAPMQDPEAAIFAAMEYKKTRWWVVGLKAAATLAPYGGAALLGLQAFGVNIPDSANTIAGSLNGGTALFNALHQESAKLTVPATWLRDGLPEIILRPGEPVAYLLALGGNPPATFSAEVGAAVVQLAATSKESLQAQITVTHPQIPDDDEARALQIAAWVRERSAMGVSQ